MPTSVFYIVSFLGAIQGTILSIVIAIKKSSHAHKYFSAFLLIFSLGLCEPYLRTILSPTNTILSFLSFSNFLYGPLIYLYVTSLSGQKTWKKVLVHLVPFVIGFLSNSIFEIFHKGFLQNEMIYFLLFELLLIQMIGYTFFAALHLRKNSQSILSRQKTFTANDIVWLRYFISFLLLIYCASFIISNAALFGYSKLNFLHRYNQVLMMLSIYMVGYKMLLKPEFLLSQNPAYLLKEPANRYSRSGLTNEKAIAYLHSLQEYMTIHKPYLDPELSVHELSQKIGISKNHLTQVVNENLGKNFYEFANDYRIQEVKQLMSDQNFENLNLSALGLQSGFKSKTGFNTNFKKATGLTPSQWKKDFVEKNRLTQESS